MSRLFHGGYDLDPSHDNRQENYAPGSQRHAPSRPSPPPSRSQASYPPPVNRGHPSAHPDSSYNRLRAQKHGASPNYYYEQPDRSFATTPPVQGYRGREIGHSQSVRTTRSTVTPGADNLSARAAGGGIAGVAAGVASSNGRGPGLDEMRGYQYETEGMYQGHPTADQSYAQYPDRGHHPGDGYGGYDGYPSNGHGGAPMDEHGYHNGGSQYAGPDRGMPAGYFQEGPYQRGPGMYNDPYQQQYAIGNSDPSRINPNDILDDGDDGFLPNPQRRSLLSLGRNTSHNSLPSGAAAAGAGSGGAAVGGSALGGTPMGAMSDRGGEGSPAGLTQKGAPGEGSSEWLTQQKTGKKKLKWIIGIIIAICIIGGVVGGVLGGILPKKGNSSGDSEDKSNADGPGEEIQDADEDQEVNGDLGKDSAEIKALMDNPDLHKVFPGIDYTPWGTQYPLCLTYPPSQNNVTRDMAILSQMTNVVRLYGTDCNQTQMVLHAIDRLELTDMKLWMGVWIDTNTTTNDRQLEQMYDILDSVDDISVFKGVIVGNEFLFRGHQTQESLQTLSNYLNGVKTKFADLDIDLPVATSDLGDAWTESLAKISDAVMSNVHPFFGGMPVDEAAAWTVEFWGGHNKPLTDGTNKENIIAEVGWPTGGGNYCNPNPCEKKTDGSVAGIKELNKFMEDWICPALENGTNYFWYVMFSIDPFALPSRCCKPDC